MQPLSSLMWAEIALGISALVTAIVLVGYLRWDILPWIIICTLNFFYIAGLNLI